MQVFFVFLIVYISFCSTAESWIYINKFALKSQYDINNVTEKLMDTAYGVVGICF